jgi:putative membrane protein
MLLEIILATFVGISLGIFTGLSPGIHVNLVSVLMLSISGVVLDLISPLAVAVIIVAMAVTHTFLDTIPSIFLGAPEESTAMSILPGHRYLLQGRAFEAVQLALIGALGGLILSLLFLPLFLLVTKGLYSWLQPFIGWILLVLCGFMILREGNKLWALTLFMISGCLGLIVFALPVKEPLFPLFSGMFGVSMLISSLRQKVNIPKQEFTNVEENEKWKAMPCAVFVGWIASFMPGLGPAQAAVIGSLLVKLEEKGFMILVGGLSTVNMVLSLVSFYELDKARNGAIVVVSRFLEIQFSDFLILIFVSLIAGGVATILTLKFAKIFSNLINKVNYQKLCFFVICLIVIIVTLLCGWVGLLILIVSIAVGVIPEVKGIARSHMMGCLMVPVIIYFLL